MFNLERRLWKSQKGFTLVELVIVIAIIGILALILLPRFTGFTNKAKATEGLAQAKNIATAIDSLLAEGKTINDTNVLTLAFGDDTEAARLSTNSSGGFIWSYTPSGGTTTYFYRNTSSDRIESVTSGAPTISPAAS